MGTNYYLYQNTCPHCGRGDEEYHIGLENAGWCFSVHVDPSKGINSLGELQQLMWKDGASIRDEYGNRISVPEMLRIITERIQDNSSRDVPSGYSGWDDFHRKNKSQFGPNGLLRHKIDDQHCVGHGDGTWDLIIGEFS